MARTDATGAAPGLMARLDLQAVAVVPASPEASIGVLHDVCRLADWYPRLRSIRPMPEGSAADVEIVCDLGRRTTTATARLDRLHDGLRLSDIDHDAIDIDIRWRVAPDAGGAAITLAVTGTVRGLLGRAVQVGGGRLRQALIETPLESFRRRMDSPGAVSLEDPSGTGPRTAVRAPETTGHAGAPAHRPHDGLAGRSRTSPPRWIPRAAGYRAVRLVPADWERLDAEAEALQPPLASEPDAATGGEPGPTSAASDVPRPDPDPDPNLDSDVPVADTTAVEDLRLDQDVVNGLLRLGHFTAADLAATGLRGLARLARLEEPALAQLRAAVPWLGDEPDRPGPPRADMASTDRRPLEQLPLAAMTRSALRDAGYRTVDDLLGAGAARLSRLPGVGAAGIVELTAILPALASGSDAPGVPDTAPLSALGLDVRTYRRLTDAGLRTVGDIRRARAQFTDRPDRASIALPAAIDAALQRLGAPAGARSVMPLGQVSARRPVSPATDARRRQVAEMRLEGRTLAEIGRAFGLSPERVRQILDQAGVDRDRIAAAGAARLGRQIDEHADAILTAYRRGERPAEIAMRLDLRAELVHATIRLRATDADRALRRASRAAARPAAQGRYTDSQLLDAMRSVADELGAVPSSSDYSRAARRRGLPSLPTVANRFGGWVPAVEAAGMTPRRRPRAYRRRWSVDACWQALRRLTAELGGPPTADQYELLASSDEALPSLATVRNRLGRWSTIVARLYDGTEHPLLARLGISDDAPPAEREERIWLAYLADELDDRELARLATDGLFVWRDTYGEPPETLTRTED